MKLIISGNEVNLCESCEKNWESCDAYDGDYYEGDNGICCCAKYVACMTNDEMNPEDIY